MFLDLVKQARSHRGFRQDRKVTRQELEHLVECARFTPAARNDQVLKYYLAEKPETVAAIQPLTKWAGALAELHLPRKGAEPVAYIVICLDDDGQTPADEVDKLLGKLEEGFDAVYASYEHKQHSTFRNMGSKVNELMTRMMLDKPADLYISSYFAVKRFVVEDMIRYENSYPYVIGLVLRATKNITNVAVCHREREEGSSGYTLKKLLGLWFNGFTAFSVKPLRIATTLGVGCAGMGFLYGIYTIIKRLVNPNVPMGFSALMAAVVFFGGMIMIMLGLIGEYVGRIYISMNNSPQYVIREKIHLGEEDR